MFFRLKKAFLIFFVLVAVSVSAQDQGIENLPRFDKRVIHFGFTLGFNQMNFSLQRPEQINPADSVLSVVQKPQFGFQIAIVSDLRLTENLNLRFVPGLSFGDRTVQYDIFDSHNNQVLIIQKTAESTFLDFPLLFKYKTNRINNFRAYVLFGGKYSLDLASQSKKKREDEATLKLLPNDYSADIGTGVELYLEYFKFGIELRMSYGFPNVLKSEDNIYASSITSLKSKIFWLGFTFE